MCVDVQTAAVPLILKLNAILLSFKLTDTNLGFTGYWSRKEINGIAHHHCVDRSKAYLLNFSYNHNHLNLSCLSYFN